MKGERTSDEAAVQFTCGAIRFGFGFGCGVSFPPYITIAPLPTRRFSIPLSNPVQTYSKMPIDPKTIPFNLGLHEVAPNTYVYLQPVGGWGLSNAGLIVGDGESFLVDTLFDVGHTQVMLDKLAPIVENAPIVSCLNTHENGNIALL